MNKHELDLPMAFEKVANMVYVWKDLGCLKITAAKLPNCMDLE